MRVKAIFLDRQFRSRPAGRKVMTNLLVCRLQPEKRRIFSETCHIVRTAPTTITGRHLHPSLKDVLADIACVPVREDASPGCRLVDEFLAIKLYAGQGRKNYMTMSEDVKLTIPLTYCQWTSIEPSCLRSRHSRVYSQFRSLGTAPNRLHLFPEAYNYLIPNAAHLVVLQVPSLRPQ